MIKIQFRNFWKMFKEDKKKKRWVAQPVLFHIKIQDLFRPNHNPYFPLFRSGFSNTFLHVVPVYESH